MSPALRSWLVIALAAVLAAADLAAAEPGTGALRREIADFVHSRAGVDRSAIEVPKLDDFRVDESSGRVEAQLSAHPREDFDGPTPITVRLLSAGSEIKRGVVTVDVKRTETVLVATRPLRANTELREADVESATHPGRVPKNALSTRDQVVGRRTTRAIRAGTTLREHHVRTSPAIGRGDLVRLVLRRGGLQIAALGRAREDGQPGDRVRVLNLDSRREVLGEVRDDGVVHVAF